MYNSQCSTCGFPVEADNSLQLFQSLLNRAQFDSLATSSREEILRVGVVKS